MGFNTAWIACRDKSLDTMIADLRLKRTGRRETIPEAVFDGIALPSGWALVVNNFADGDFLLEEKLERVRAGTQGLTCTINDTTMTSMISGFRGEADVWSVTHDAEKGRMDLEVEGTPPAPFASLRDRLTAQQTTGAPDTDDLYDIAAQMGAALTGFRHDENASRSFEVLERAKLFGLFRRG